MKKKPFEHQMKEFTEHGLDSVRAIHWEQGCFSGDTEYLSPEGWRRIDSYSGGRVAQWDQKTNNIEFVIPSEYVVKECKEMICIKTKYGVDMKVSPGHRVPYLTKHGKHPKEATAAALAESLKGSTGFRHLPSTFIYCPNNDAIPLSIPQIRLQVAVMADGHFPSRTLRCVVRLKKQRKIERLHELLQLVGMDKVDKLSPEGYTVRDSGDFKVFTFYAPMRIKKYPNSWIHASYTEREAILDEVLRWDGTAINNRRAYFSKHESDVDVIQTLFACAGEIARKAYGNQCWEVHIRKDITPFTVRYKNFSIENTDDGKMYCFCVPTEFLLMRRNGCIFPSGNTGKSYLALWEAEALYRLGEIDALFVLAPNGLHTNWVIYEIPDLLETPHVALAYQSKKAKTKRHQQEVKEVLNFRQGLAVMTMSYDAIKTEAGKKAAKDFLTKRKCFYILDESNRIKTPSAKVTRTVVSSGRYAKYKRTLCGTPITNSPFDIYTQFRFLDPDFWKNTNYGLSAFEDFKTFFGIWEKGYNSKNGREFKQCVAYQNLHILSELVSSLASRVLKEDVLKDLPPKLYAYRGFDMTPKQVNLYVQIEEEFMAEINGELLFTPLAITRSLRLQQVVCGYLPTGDENACTPIDAKNPRLQLLNEICQDLPHKAIIWARFIHDIDMICDMLGDKAVRWDGTVSDEQREENKYRFKKEPVDKVQFLVATPDSMSEGHTLNEAKTMIYYSNSYKLKDRLQSEDRNHRAGQYAQVNIIDLVANNSKDIEIIEALRAKFDSASLVVDKKLRKWLLTYNDNTGILSTDDRPSEVKQMTLETYNDAFRMMNNEG